MTAVRRRFEKAGTSPLAAALIPALMLSACSLAPAYKRPSMASIPPSFKEAPGWRIAAPSDAVARGEWWTVFGDPVLDALEQRVIVSNQNLAGAKAAYDQARALVREQRAATLPTVTLQGKANDAGSFAKQASTNSNNGVSGETTGTKAFSLGVGATWEPDIWAALGAISQSKAQAQASEADLVNATLSAQGELALNYIQLRGIEAQRTLLDRTVVDYQRALTITTNMYNAGISARSDVLQAETALHNARGDAADLVRQRAILEHAIAVLVGENPSTFSVPAGSWSRTVPDVPSILPSTLLERRPDVAGAERRVAAANAEIGIQRAAFFPTLSLTGQSGFTGDGLGSLFAAANSAWSLGLTGALTLLDFGQRSAKVAQARAQYEQSVATYRQTALTAFQQVEDQLAAVRVLETVGNERSAATEAANRAETIARNQYASGQIGYSDVIVVQNTALSSRTADIQARVSRQTAAISLMQAIGGYWVEPEKKGSGSSPSP